MLSRWSFERLSMTQETEEPTLPFPFELPGSNPRPEITMSLGGGGANIRPGSDHPPASNRAKIDAERNARITAARLPAAFRYGFRVRSRPLPRTMRPTP